MAMKPGFRIITASIFGLAVAIPIFLINYNLSPLNTTGEGLIEIILLSVVLFIDIFLAFVSYWLIRNLFSKRWVILEKSPDSRIFRIPINKLRNSSLTTEEEFNIISLINGQVENPLKPVYDKATSLFCEIIYPKNININALILYCHGFNDSSEKIRYKTYALAELGYTVFVWDARGMGKSSKAGKKGDFLTRNMDTAALCKFLIQLPIFKDYKFIIVGESMGGISAAYVLNQIPKKIDKCILISTPSIFNQTFKRRLFPFSRRWIQRLNYRIKGINPYPKGESNALISPYLLFQDMMKGMSKQDWFHYTNKKILLIHSKTDKLIPLEKCEQNSEILNLIKKNRIIFNTGNHNQIKNELGIISTIDAFSRR
ncbi:MAG: alpha/beta fold hydrolase [Candidatus Lokiarchaeota archaeon]|nr:alpha/beta fold hydrolase [Candidatus Lokiarchaeota archaeon]